MSEKPNQKEELKEQLKEQHKKQSKKASSSDSIISGWLLISSLCVVAFLLDVPIGIIIVAIIGYAISAS